MSSESTTTKQQQHALKTVLDGLMRRYKERVPDVAHIIQKMIEHAVIEDESDR